MSSGTSPILPRQLLPAFLLVLLLGVFALPAGADQRVYYRYLDENGVSVLDYSIPPEYAQKGYEIVKLSGEVVKTVPPALAADPETQARIEAAARMRKSFERLSRRYSSPDEIESAKQRKLANIDTNIAILNGNISGLEAQIEQIRAEAADVERAGRAVPEAHLQKLANTRAELASAKELLIVRKKEYDDAAARFDEDMEIYAKGQKQVLSGLE